jgi:YebC/PmpR family DNA-binding regulatory protein
MSGHNKWSKIKHKKAASDSKKSAVFGKLVRLIQVEAKLCNGDINSPSLKIAIEKAKKENMPKDNIDRAIKKASESGDVSPVMFEAYGPGGVGIIITGLTDNNNRTSQEIRHILSKQGAALGAQGSVAWNFTKNKETGEWEPSSTLDLDDNDLEKLSTLVDALEDNEDVQDVYTNAS